MSIQRMEIVTGSGRRRRFSRAKKEEIVAQTLVAGATVAEVARRHDVERSLLYRWRRELGVVAGKADGAMFLPVAVSEERALPAKPLHDDKRRGTAVAGCGLIAIDVGGRCVRVGSDFDAAALHRVLDVLESRAGGMARVLR
jgi:transposase